jgi:hypothetical protein
MKFPWDSSKKQSNSNSNSNSKKILKSEQEKTTKTYKLNSLPNNLQKIALLLQHTNKEMTYLKKKLEVASKVKENLEQELSKGVKEIKE